MPQDKKKKSRPKTVRESIDDASRYAAEQRKKYGAEYDRTGNRGLLNVWRKEIQTQINQRAKTRIDTDTRKRRISQRRKP
jgi:hypothetical protein